jgi:hypothetical protein
MNSELNGEIIYRQSDFRTTRHIHHVKQICVNVFLERLSTK